MDDSIVAMCRALVERYRSMPLFTVPGAPQNKVVTLTEGYMPLLVNFTHEDQEAKGLRSLREDADQPRPAVYFSALEQVASTPLMLLLGERGSGKTSFTRHLALHLAGEIAGSADFNIARLTRSAPRNEQGFIAEEAWTGPTAIPICLDVAGPTTFADLLARLWPEAGAVLDRQSWRRGEQALLLIIDEADRLGEAGPAFLDEALDFASRHSNIRLLIAGESSICANWVAPTAFAKHSLLPLLASQRRMFLADRFDLATHGDKDLTLLGNPGLFGLSLWLEHPPSLPYQLVDRWLEVALAGLDRVALAEVSEEGFKTFASRGCLRHLDDDIRAALEDRRILGTLEKTFVLEYLAALHLRNVPIQTLLSLFHEAPGAWAGVASIVASAMRARGAPLDELVAGLIEPDSDAGLIGAILSARFLADAKDNALAPLRPPTASALLRTVEEGRLSVRLREQAGRLLARWGDPRDLEALVEVAGATFTMGSTAQPNSSPPHQVMGQGFKIGKYPITNGLYARFSAASERLWPSSDGRHPERANAPAVDLTWHDARACCEWLTHEWRKSGKIGATEIVRLPTEPEWELAARGLQPDAGMALIYPWQGEWRPDRSNSEEAGFNNTCTVGLFPKGISPCGCHDMVGQIWEWTSTLWGDDMATPSWTYPYRRDGREAPDAGPTIRRVLRGGCFSSAKQKACCTYRGSLEPNGFWRGNGFRVVVS